MMELGGDHMILTEYCDSCGFNYPVTVMQPEMGPDGPATGDGLWCGYCMEDEGWAFDWPRIERTP